MKKEIDEIALHAEKIAAIYKGIDGSELTPEVLRLLVGMVVVEILADRGIIARSILSQSNLYHLIGQRLTPFVQNPDIKQEGEKLHAILSQAGKNTTISLLFPQLRDALWRLDRENTGQKVSGGTRRLKKSLGIYETPPFLAEFLALVIQFFTMEFSLILDPASGSGNLLAPFCKNENVTDLYAIDTDEIGLLLAEIGILARIPHKYDKRIQLHPMLSDFLSLDLSHKIDLVVSNPPWGISPASLQQYDREKFPASYKNQADSWALFLEKSAQILEEKKGLLAFIIPNTLCLNPNFEGIRRFLLQSFTILFILNLGEGIFPLVTQPAMLFIARKTPAPQDHAILVQVFRCSDRQESRVKQLSEWLPRTAEELKRFLLSSEKFNQLSFLTGTGSRFEIFSRTEESHLIQKIYSNSHYTFGDFVTNSRGVEIGKRAEVIQCPECKKWNPPPKWSIELEGKCASCTHCKTKIWDNSSLKKVNIIKQITHPHTDHIPDMAEILVGEQISKFLIKGHNYIRTDLEGIYYKPNHIYNSPKILVRKTGREINAAIDWENRMTVQVVYIFQLKSRLPSQIPIEILLCILNSSLLLFVYFHRFGDPEKRSYAHYIQAHLKLLPMPDLGELSGPLLFQIENIIQGHPKFGQCGLSDNEQRNLDLIINRLYGLTPEDIQIVEKWTNEFLSL